MQKPPAVDPGQQALDIVYADLEARKGKDFMTHHPERGTHTIQSPQEVAAEVAGMEPGDLRRYFQLQVKALREGSVVKVSFPVGLLSTITREEIAALEAEGVVLSGVNERHPHGGIYLKDKTASSLDAEAEVTDSGTIKAIMATGLLKPVTALVSKAPAPGIPKKLSGLPSIPVNCVVAAVYHEGHWSQSAVLPFGNWVVPGFDNTSFQYGESAFEGGTATEDGEVIRRTVKTPDGQDLEQLESAFEIRADEYGKITIFRPEKNARRMIKSAESVGLKAPSVDQQVQAVIAAVKNNKNFLPPGGKLYIRSFIVGLRGGTGIKPASQALFAVEVAPYGDYMSKGGESTEARKQLTLKGVYHPRGEMGPDKVPSNYLTLIKKRYEAQAKGFADIVLLDENANVQECASNNLFRVCKIGEKSFKVSTPSLIFNQLPGNTRESLLEVLRDPTIQERLGYEIEVEDNGVITESDLLDSQTTGLFSSGTAAGITAFDGYSPCDRFENALKPLAIYNDQETRQFIISLAQLLKDLRQGKVPGYEHLVVTVE